MTDLKVVSLHDGPPLNDIPEQLRALADRIESGDYGQVDSLYAIMPRDEAYPLCLGWGSTDGAYDPTVQFFLAHQWMVRAAVGLPID